MFFFPKNNKICCTIIWQVRVYTNQSIQIFLFFTQQISEMSQHYLRIIGSVRKKGTLEYLAFWQKIRRVDDWKFMLVNKKSSLLLRIKINDQCICKICKNLLQLGCGQCFVHQGQSIPFCHRTLLPSSLVVEHRSLEPQRALSICQKYSCQISSHLFEFFGPEHTVYILGQ